MLYEVITRIRVRVPELEDRSDPEPALQKMTQEAIGHPGSTRASRN